MNSDTNQIENVFNEEECAQFIQDGLLKSGVIVSIEDINRVLDLELEYMVKVGLAHPAEEDYEI